MSVPGPVARQSGLVAERHRPWAKVARMIACPCDAAKVYVGRIVLQLDWVYDVFLKKYPTNQWWKEIESDVLRYYPGLKHIVVQVSARGTTMPAFRLVFQRKDLRAVARGQDYKSVLADAISPFHRAGSLNIEAICNAVVASQTEGELKSCTFGVEMVSWTNDNLFEKGLGIMKGKCSSIHLGYG